MKMFLFIQFLCNLIINHIFYGKKLISTITIIGSLIFGIVLINLYQYIGVYSSIIMFLFFLILNQSLDKKWNESIYKASFTRIISIIGDHFYGFIITDVININDYSFGELAIYVLVYLTTNIIITLIIKWFINKTFKNSIKPGLFQWVISIFSFFTYFCYSIVIILGRKYGETSEIQRLNFFFLVTYFSIFIISLYILMISQKSKYEGMAKKAEYKNLKIYTESLETSYQEMRRFRHDYINVMASMLEYINNKDMRGLEDYFNNDIIKMSKKIEKNNFKLKDLNNIKIAELKGLISAKIILAQEKELDISFEALERIERIDMDMVSLCRCVGILIDNAIEEVTLNKKGKIRIAALKYNNSVSLIVENYFKSRGIKVYQYFVEGFSTKGDNRGMGLSNLKRIIEENKNVHLDTRINGEYFTQEINIINLEVGK